MAQFVNVYDVDLMKPNAPKQLQQMVCEGDAKGNRIGANVYNNGSPVSLGGQCVGKVVRADGTTVQLTGTVSGNQAYVVLDQTSCAVEGQIQVAVCWVSGTNVTTLVVAYGTVINTQTGTAVQPSTPIPDLTQLLAEIDNMRTATAAANAAAEGALSNFAPAFSESVVYTAGQYVTYTDGKLYVFTADHAAGAWNSAHVHTVTTGSKLTDMNTAVELIQEGTTNAIDGYYLDSNGDLVANSEYMVSDFIALTNPGGAIIWHYGAGLDTFAKGVAYQADKTTKTITSPIVSWEERTEIQFSSSYVYLRISIKKANAGSTFVAQGQTVLYDKPFAQLSLEEMQSRINNADGQIADINHTIYDQKNATDNCRLNSDGNLVDDSDYIVSDYIPILSPGNNITWHYGPGMSTDAKGIVYKADKVTKIVISPISSLEERSDLAYSDTYVYMRISVKKANASVTTVKQGSTTLYQNPVAESGMDERMDTVPFYTPFIVGTYNVRSYQGATGPDSNDPLTPEQIAVILPEMREALSRMTADVLVCSEDYRNWFDGSIGDTTGTKQVPVYENLYEHYYPYYYKTSFLDFGGPNIYSKYPIIDKDDILPDYSPYTSRRKISFAVIDYFGKHICIIGCHAEPGDSAQSAEMRAAYFTAINAKAAEYDFVVIAGDTNVFATSELTDVFSESVYQLGNRGYFGTIRTYVSQNYAFDNIITKGFTINNFNVVDVEYSDHYPCDSKVNFRL